MYNFQRHLERIVRSPFFMGLIIWLVFLILVAGAIKGEAQVIPDGGGGQSVHYTHHCHEDEFQIVFAEGLACIPVDDVLTEEELFNPVLWEQSVRVIATQYEFAR